MSGTTNGGREASVIVVAPLPFDTGDVAAAVKPRMHRRRRDTSGVNDGCVPPDYHLYMHGNRVCECGQETNDDEVA